jgi:hypothetical protein
MNMDTVEKARTVVADLKIKLAAVGDKATALAVERRRLAYDASVGDAKAKSRLEKLTGESAVVAIENENAHAALIEARSRLDSAEHAAALAEKKAAAERLQKEVKELADRVAARGPSMSNALAGFFSEYVALQADTAALRGLGANLVPARTIELAFETLLAHTCRAVGIKIGDLVEPARRHSVETLVESYATRARTWADGSHEVAA